VPGRRQAASDVANVRLVTTGDSDLEDETETAVGMTANGNGNPDHVAEARTYLLRMVGLLLVTVAVGMIMFRLLPTQPERGIVLIVLIVGFAALITTQQWTLSQGIDSIARTNARHEAAIVELEHVRHAIVDTVQMQALHLAKVLGTVRSNSSEIVEVHLLAKSIYTLVNTQYGSSLQSLANVSMRLAELTGSQADRLAAEKAASTLRDHEAKQTLISVTVGGTLPIGDAATAVLSAAEAAAEAAKSEAEAGPGGNGGGTQPGADDAVADRIDEPGPG
jgi:hypothetical protein